MPFLSSFPYVATPHQGYDHAHHALGDDLQPAAPVAGPATTVTTTPATTVPGPTTTTTAPPTTSTTLSQNAAQCAFIKANAPANYAQLQQIGYCP
jgi:hypothetical protein